MREGRLMFVAGLGMMLAAALMTVLARDGAAAQTVPPAEVAAQQIDPSSPLTLAEARTIIEGAIGYAQSINQPVGVSVVDPGGHVISQDLMDGPGFGTLTHANGKAFAAAMLRTPTSEIAGLLETSPNRYYSIMNMWPGQVYLTGGGIPLRVNGRVVGAAGVSGTTGVDAQAVEAGIAAWGQMRPGAGQ